MKSRTHQQWRELFKQQADSDLSVAAIKLQYQQTRLHFPTTVSPSWLAEFVKALA